MKFIHELIAKHAICRRNLFEFTTSTTEQSIKSNAVAQWNKYVNDERKHGEMWYINPCANIYESCTSILKHKWNAASFLSSDKVTIVDITSNITWNEEEFKITWIWKHNLVFLKKSFYTHCYIPRCFASSQPLTNERKTTAILLQIARDISTVGNNQAYFEWKHCILPSTWCAL